MAGGDGELLAVGRQVASDLARDDTALTRAALAAGLSERGVRVGTGRASELLATLRSERDAEHHDRHLTAVGTRL